MFHWFKRHNREGAELPDPTPIEIPLDGQRPPTLQQRIAQFCGNPEVNRLVANRGMDTFEEADDFEVPEDEAVPDFVNVYPTKDMADEILTRGAEIAAGHVAPIPQDRLERAEDRIREAKKKKLSSPPAPPGTPPPAAPAKS